MIVVDLAGLQFAFARFAQDLAARQPRAVEPTVVGFRPLPTATRHPPWDPESFIVDDLGPAPARRERRVR